MTKPARLGLVAAVCSALAWITLPPASAATEGDAVARHSLRGDLTDQKFYFVMGDRFENGDPGNDEGELTGDRMVTGFDPTSRGFYNGGDLKGLRSRLDYVQRLGTDAIWLTPIFKNKPVQPEDGPSAGYHGYWITDFTQIDPHLGTNQDLTDLVDAAHARGIKVFFDIITNHTADVIGYTEGDRTAYVSKDAEPYRTASGAVFDDRDFAGTNVFPPLDLTVSFPYTPVLAPGEENLKKPLWLNNVRLYHNRGNTTFTGEDSQYGDFFGLDDLFTEHPRVVRGMERIYQTWVRDFGIDGFRIDTMKHVNDEFWRQFLPGVLDYAHRNGKPDFFMFGEVSTPGYDTVDVALTAHYPTRAKAQSVLDFPFMYAARDFASRSADGRQLSQFFRADDWYTDADSNVYQLPTFLGNHDFGRIGWFVASDNPGATDAELLARDRLAHALMYLSRGNPIVYYGDEQGFTGTGGDQLARQSMFPSLVPDYVDDDSIGTDASPADGNFDPSHPLYRTIRRLAELTERHPALRDGAHQMRFASDGPGIVAFSRVDRMQRREYVVVLNNDESAAAGAVPTYSAHQRFVKLYGPGAHMLRAGGNGKVHVRLPGLAAAVYAASGRIPKSPAAPAIHLIRPAPAEAAHGRMRVSAQVAGGSFYEVTFQAKIGSGRWRWIGTDDTAAYRVFHDTSTLRTGTRLRYRAVVLDNAGHTRVSNVRRTAVAAPAITVTAPTDGGNVTRIDPVTVTAVVDPERATQRVRFQRSIAGGAWQAIGVDRSSPAYTVRDDLSGQPLGTQVRYRAILLEPGALPVTSDPVTVTVALPEPLRDSVTLAGDLQSELGCPGDWQPDCALTHLEFDTSDGQWHGTFTLPEGSYQWKVAIDDAWTESYGANGGGDNIPLTVPAGGGTYRFSWNQATHVPTVADVG